MKLFLQRVLSLTIAFAVLISLAITVGAASNTITIELNGQQISFMGTPFIDNQSRTQVPASFGDALGLSMTESGGSITFQRGETAVTFTVGSRQAGKISMDTVPTVVAGEIYVPLKYLAEAFGFQVGWDGTARAISITDTTSGILPTVGDIQRIQAHTDTIVYGQGLVSAEVTYKPGTDLSAITVDSYVLEDRGTLNPDFGQVRINGVTVNGQTVTLDIYKDTYALPSNALVYNGENATGSRQRNAFGVYCTGAWYRGVDGVIYYGKEDTANYKANTTGMGYQTRACLEMRLRHTGEPAVAAACLATEIGEYNASGLWEKTIDKNMGEGGFVTFEQAGIQVPSTSIGATDRTGDDYVRGWIYVPNSYNGSKAVPLVITIQGHGTSYWKLPDGTNNFGTGMWYDTSTTAWMESGAIVVNIHDRSSAGFGGANYDYVADNANVIKYLLEHYHIDEDSIILHGNSRSTMAGSTLIQALAGQLYTTNQVAGNWGDMPRDHRLDKEVYDFTISIFLCNNGTLGGEGLWKEADYDAVAKTGLRVWCFDSEQDFNNITTTARYAASLTKAGYSDEWIEENLRLTAYPSELFYYWGESDHSVTRLNYWYFLNHPYLGPNLKVVNGEIIYSEVLQSGNTYELQCRGERSGQGSKEGHWYTIYGGSILDWVLPV